MPDSRFFHRRGPFTLGELAEEIGAEPASSSDAATQVVDVAPLHTADADCLTFLDNPKYAEQLVSSKAGACLLHPKYRERAPQGMALLLSADPYRAYAKAATLFYPGTKPAADVSAAAIVAADAVIADGVSISAGAVIGSQAEIGAGTVIHANAVIGEGVVVGRDCVIGSGVSLVCAKLGDRVILHSGVRIGQDGFGFAPGRDGHLKVPQLGRVLIGHDVEIGANSCIDRGAGPDTVIGDGCKIDNLVQIGHNVTLGRGCIVVAQVGIAGSTRIGNGVMIGGQVGIAGHLVIEDGAQIAAGSGVTKSIPPGQVWGGYPAVPVRQWHRQSVMLAGGPRRKKEAKD